MLAPPWSCTLQPNDINDAGYPGCLPAKRSPPVIQNQLRCDSDVNEGARTLVGHAGKVPTGSRLFSRTLWKNPTRCHDMAFLPRMTAELLELGWSDHYQLLDACVVALDC